MTKLRGLRCFFGLPVVLAGRLDGFDGIGFPSDATEQD
jgi:hypothetical protein